MSMTDFYHRLSTLDTAASRYWRRLVEIAQSPADPNLTDAAYWFTWS